MPKLVILFMFRLFALFEKSISLQLHTNLQEFVIIIRDKIDISPEIRLRR